MKKIIIYLNVIAICFLISFNHGIGQWEQIANFDERINSIVFHNDDIFVLAQSIYQVNQKDGEWTNSMIKPPNLFTLSLLSKNDTLFAGTAIEGIFLTTDNGSNWTEINNGLKHKDVFLLTNSGDNIFAGTWGGGIFVSSDNGMNWKEINNGIKNLYIRDIEIYNDTIIAGTKEGIFFSTNFGLNWIEPKNNGLNYKFIKDVNFDGQTLLISNGQGIFLSTNLGDIWISIKMELEDLDIESFLFINNIIVVGNNNGIYYSSLDGNHWIDINNNINLSTKIVYLLKIDNDYIYSAFYGGSLFRAKISDLITSVEEKPLTNSSTLLYPNPAQEYLEISNLREETNYQIFSIEGILQSEGKTFGRINVSNWACGIYYIRIADEVLRFVKM